MKFSPTVEQIAIKNALINRENIAVIAGPGSAKTSTSEWIVREHLPSNAKVLYLTFSKALALEAAQKMPSNVYCSTINSIGYALMRQEYDWAYGDNEEKKFYKYPFNLDFMLKNKLSPKQKEYWLTRENLLKLFAFARYDNSNFSKESLEQVAFEHSVDFSPYAQELLPQLFAKGIQLATRGNNRKTKTYQSWDFIDQIRIPVEHKIMPNAGMILGEKKLNQFWPKGGYDYIIIDEFQDFNIIQAMLVELIWGKSCLMIVGDPLQSIYEFMGSAPGIMQKFIEMHNLNMYTLSEVFRCPSNIVQLLNEKFGTTLTGKKSAGEISSDNWQNMMDSLTPQTAILVRNVRGKSPAFNFLSTALQRGIPLNIKKLELSGTINRVFKMVENAAKEAGYSLEWKDYQSALRDLSLSAPRFSKLELDEQIGMINLFISVSGANSREKFDEFVANYEQEKLNAPTLMTIHASKGQEFPDVILLGSDDLGKVKKGATPRQAQAERCVSYVGHSRPLHKLRFDTSSRNSSFAGNSFYEDDDEEVDE